MSPQRIQRKRSKGWRMPEGAVYVGRPTKWGNPFAVVPEPNHPRWAGPRHSVVQTPDGRIWMPEQTTKPAFGRSLAEQRSKRQAAQLAVDLFSLHIGPMGSYEYPDEQWEELGALAGRDFVCWCPEGWPCHADVLLELANGDPS